MRIKFILYLVVLTIALHAEGNVGDSKDIDSAKVFLTTHNYAQVIRICNKNIEVSTKKMDQKTHSWFLSVKGLAYLDTLDADSGRMFFEKSLSEAYSINYKKSICNSLFGLGKYYYRNSNYLLSVKYFKLLDYYSLNDPDPKYQLISNYFLSANYNLLNKHRISINYGRKAAYFSSQMKDTSSYIKSLVSIGNEFFGLEEIDTAEHYYEMADRSYKEYSRKNIGLGADIYNAFMKANTFKKQYEKAISYGKKAISDCIAANDLASLNMFYDNVAVCYKNKKMYDSAIFYFTKALELELNYNYVDEYKADLKELFYLHKITNNNEKAFFYIEKLMNADSLYLRENSDVVDSLKTAFEFEKGKITLKAKEEKLQEIYKKKQLFYLSIGIILLLVFTIVPYSIYLRKLLKREKEKQTLLLKVKDSEIKALQLQMNPHFIFNSLNSVLEFISRSETEEAIKYLTKFSRLIRLVLEFSNRKMIFLSEEIELLRLYVDLENIRSENGFVFNLSIEEGIDLKNYEIHPMLLQPFIENSIIHGIQNKVKVSESEKKNYNGELKVTFSIQDEFLKCIIEDNGIGREKALEIKNSKSFNHLSLGMQITSERLNLISQKVNKIDYYDLKDENNTALGTRIEILIPLFESF